MAKNYYTTLLVAIAFTKDSDTLSGYLNTEFFREVH